MTAPDVLAIGLRALGFVSVLQAAGTALFLSVFDHELETSVRTVRLLAKRSAIAGILITMTYQIAESGRLIGDFAGIFDASMQMLLLSSDVGATHGIRIVGLLMLAVVLLKTARLSYAVALIGATLVAVSFAFMGHTATHDQRWLLAGLLTLHVLVVAFWFGALLPLYVVTRREAVSTKARVIEGFSHIAAWLVPLIFVAGIVMMLSLLPNLASLQTTYGLSLLAKIVVFSSLMGIAAANKWRLGPRIAAGGVDAQRVFGRTVLIEWLLITVVLTISAAMTSLFSPGH